MIYATFDLEVLDDIAFLALQDTDPGHPWRWMRVVQVAKRANEKGRVLSANGVALDAKHFTRLHEGRGADASVWESFLAQCRDLGLLHWDEDNCCYQVVHWRRWHRSPSDEPDKTAERKRQERERKRGFQEQLPDVTRCHEMSRAVTDVTTQSKAEQNITKIFNPPSPPPADKYNDGCQVDKSERVENSGEDEEKRKRRAVELFCIREMQKLEMTGVSAQVQGEIRSFISFPRPPTFDNHDTWLKFLGSCLAEGIKIVQSDNSGNKVRSRPHIALKRARELAAKAIEGA